MPTVHQVAAYFLATWPEDSGEGISNMKLQKLCYYAQGFQLANIGQPLFQEAIEAWEQGPVIPELYERYASFGLNPVLVPGSFDLNEYTIDERELLDEVRDLFGQYAAWRLRNMTAEEAPFKQARASGGGVISLYAMKVYFESQLS